VSEMVERVAEAIHAACSANGIDTKGAAWDREAGSVRELYYNIARAAIEAMRQPTGAMLSPDTLGNDNRVHCDRIWGRMIDAALKDS
jgi:hypothetical protein